MIMIVFYFHVYGKEDSFELSCFIYQTLFDKETILG